MGKATWKRRGISNERIGTVIRTSRTMSEAARTLGVNRSTLHRWLEDDPSLKEFRKRKADATQEALQVDGMETSEWAETIRSSHELTPTELVLVELAEQALGMARDPEAKATDQISAMGRFQRLVQQLDLKEPVGKGAPKPERPKRPERVLDPRAALRAVK